MTPDEQIKAIAEKYRKQVIDLVFDDHDPKLELLDEAQFDFMILSAIAEATQSLQKELDEANRKLVLAEAQTQTMLKINNAQKQQLAEAVKDTQRLDWLEQYLIAGNDLRIFASDNPTSTIESRGDTGIIIRTAIDTAKGKEV